MAALEWQPSSHVDFVATLLAGSGALGAPRAQGMAFVAVGGLIRLARTVQGVSSPEVEPLRWATRIGLSLAAVVRLHA